MHPPDGRPRPAGGPERSPPPATTGWAIGPVINRADIPVLCTQLAALLFDSRAAVVICDVGRITAPDAITIEALARLQLTARRLGCDLRIDRANRRLLDLVAFVGLSDVLAVRARLAVEPRGQAEQRKQAIGVEERVDPADPAG